MIVIIIVLVVLLSIWFSFDLNKLKYNTNYNKVIDEDIMQKSKQVLVVRKDLNLSPGKIVAQCVHATLRVQTIIPYDNDSGKVCICCYVKSEEALLKLVEKAEELNIPYGLQRDTGKTEVEPNTPTVLSLGPVYGDDIEKLIKITKRLQLL